jgi:Surp module
VREAGGQSEFRLGVAQAGNPNFAFLRPGDRLFPYYRWLLQAAPDDSTAARSATLPGRVRLSWCLPSRSGAPQQPRTPILHHAAFSTCLIA